MNRRDRRSLKALTGWKPLQKARLSPLSPAELDMRVAHALRVFPHLSRQEVIDQIEDVLSDEVWCNDRYQVSVRHVEPGMTHLSVRRLDRSPVRDWRDMQRIKNQLVGAECEGVELYPAESRLVDTANQFHMFCIPDPTYRFPFGFAAGRHVTSESGGGSVQRRQ